MSRSLILAKENAQQYGVVRNLHRHTHFKALKFPAAQ